MGLKVLSTCSLRIHPVLLGFTKKKMENRGKDLIWQVSRINSTWRMTFQNVPRFSIMNYLKKMHMENRGKLD